MDDDGEKARFVDVFVGESPPPRPEGERATVWERVAGRGGIGGGTLEIIPPDRVLLL